MFPSWFNIALLEYGEKEIPGPLDNKRITEYLSAVPEYAGPINDEVAYCAAFVNWVLARAGVPGTGSALARSFLKWGNPCNPVTGSIVVFWRENVTSSWGHVGFLVRKLDSNIYCLGANQNDQVNISVFPATRVLDYRYPFKQ